MSIDNLPKVTIAIPSYNGEKVIRETIESCIIQDYPNFEIIVSDKLINWLPTPAS